MENHQYPELRAGMRIESADQNAIGAVREVFRDLGLIESFGEKGILPEQEGHDPVQYAYSEAMPGRGDDYFTVTQPEGGTLYIPFSAITTVAHDVATVAVDAEKIPDMNWHVRADALAALAHEYPEDTGAEPQVA